MTDDCLDIVDHGFVGYQLAGRPIVCLQIDYSRTLFLRIDYVQQEAHCWMDDFQRAVGGL